MLKGESLTTTYIFNNGVVTPSLDIKGKLPSSGTISVDNNCKTTVSVYNGKYTVIKTKEGELAKSTGTLKDKVDILIDQSDKYQYMNGTYLKGQQDSNYLWYSGNLYRIMGYDENNNVRLISEEYITSMSYHSSSSVFSTSNIKSWGNIYFSNHINSSILENTSYCTDIATEPLSARTTCTNAISDTKVTTLSLDEYRLSLSPKEYSCNDIGLDIAIWDNYHTSLVSSSTQTDFQNYLVSKGKTCMEYVKGYVDSRNENGMSAIYDYENEKVGLKLSYLDDTSTGNFWTLTPYSSSDSWKIFNFGNTTNDGVGYENAVRPVITISSDIIITEGSGTFNSPLMIEDMNNKTGRLIDNATSGEYVTLEDKLYRVVEKVDGVGTKIVLEGYLENKENYANMLTKMGNNTYLTELGLTSGDSRLVDYTWDRGENCYNGRGYTYSLATTTNTFVSKVGVIRMSEMYSSQSNVIPRESRKPYWSLTIYSSGYPWYVTIEGDAYHYQDTQTFGIRPVIVISPNTNIIDGSGTTDDPYKI